MFCVFFHELLCLRDLSALLQIAVVCFLLACSIQLHDYIYNNLFFRLTVDEYLHYFPFGTSIKLQ